MKGALLESFSPVLWERWHWVPRRRNLKGLALRDHRTLGWSPGAIAKGCPSATTLPVTSTRVFIGKVWVPKQKPMDPVLESVTLEPELEEALANASDAELCDIAGRRRSGSPHALRKALSCISVEPGVVYLNMNILTAYNKD